MTRPATLIITCLLGIVAAHAQLTINEVCSRNESVWQAPDGEHSDWIELHNGGPSAVQLDQFFLSDKPTVPGQWQLPAQLLSTGEFIVLYSDNSDGFPFGIDGEGETIMLSDADLNTVQSIYVPHLEIDHSYGAGSTLGTGPYYFNTPTPGSANTSAAYPGYAEAPVFNRTPGYITQGASVGASTTDGVVHWTWNGREPDMSSPQATATIAIDSTTVLQARTYRAGWLPSAVATATYVVNDQRQLPIVSLAVDPDSMFDEVYGMYMTGPNADTLWPFWGANYWEERSLPAQIEFFEADGARQLVQKVDLRVHGGRRSRTNPQRPLRITALSKYGSDVLEHPFFPERPEVDKYHTLVLRNSGGDFCISNFRDGLFHQISLHNDLDIDELGFRPAIAYVNGKYWGLIEIRERIDEQYLHYNYGADMDSVLMMEEENVSMQGDTIHFWNLMQFVYTQDLNDPANWAHVDSLFDLHSAKDYFAMEMHAGNVDWPSNNLKYWKPSITEGKWRYMLYDLDATMHLYGWIPEDLDMFYWTFLHRAGFVHSEFFRGLMTNDEFKRTYLNRLADLMNTDLSPDNFQAEVDMITTTYASEIERHFQRWNCWFDYYTSHAFGVIPHFAQNRNGFVRQSVLDFYAFPNAPLLEFDVFPPAAGSVVINTVTPPLPFSGYYFNGNAIDVTVRPNEGFVFDHWGYSADDTTCTELHWKRSFHTAGKVMAFFRNASGAMSAYPNPTTGELSLGIDATMEGTATITLTDVSRRLVAFRSVQVSAGMNKISLNITTLPAGIYMATSEVNGDRSVVKVTKQ